MEQYFSVLRRCRLFAQIGEEELGGLLGCLGAQVRTFEKKQFILAEGEPALSIGVLLSGAAQIEQVDYYGNRSLVAGLEESDVFGEAFACANVDALPIAIVAAEPCAVLLIDAHRILHTCSSGCDFHRQVIFNLMKDLAQKTLQFHRKIEILSKRTTRERLMTYLLLRAKQVGSNRFRIPFDRQQLADYLEVDRSGLSVQISRLCAEGILETKGKEFALLHTIES